MQESGPFRLESYRLIHPPGTLRSYAAPAPKVPGLRLPQGSREGALSEGPVPFRSDEDASSCFLEKIPAFRRISGRPTKRLG